MQRILSALLCGIGLSLAAVPTLAAETTLKFSGYEWTVKSGDKLGPGPNRWSPDNVWVDKAGALHLKIAQSDGVWQCAEVSTKKRFGFGTYQFQVAGRVDRLDKNVVLGLFNYPTSDVGKDGTHEMDIEFAHWGNEKAPIGNYTVWPVKTGAHNASSSFSFTLNGDYSTQRFTWKPDSLLFQSLHGHRDDDKNEFQRWLFQPAMPQDAISQQPMPVLINLWLFHGQAPSDGKPVEIVIKQFKFTSLQPSVSVGYGTRGQTLCIAHHSPPTCTRHTDRLACWKDRGQGRFHLLCSYASYTEHARFA
ncbi:MAG TPA: glycoside hydrolase family 16 protein [Chthonomonadaceae bacterium]|nr:glycoside hydrolase family 16 protein [Chthonomonadaceae bacterium]